MFNGAETREYSPQNGQKLESCQQICPSLATRLHTLYKILSVWTRLYVSFKFLIWSFSGDKQPSYKHFPRWGHFSTNFQ